MKSLIGGVLALALAAPALGAQDDPKDKPKEGTPREQYQALLKEHQQAVNEYVKAVQAAKTPEQQQKVFEEKSPKAEKFAPRFVALAEKNPKDPVALDALVWVMTNPLGRSGPNDVRGKAVAMLTRDHLESPKLAQVCARMSFAVDTESVRFLRAVLDKNPHQEVQAEACMALAQSLQQRIEIAKRIQADPKSARQYEGFLGKELFEELSKTDPAKIETQSEGLYRQIAEKHAPGMATDKLVTLCQNLARNPGKGGELVLRTMLDKSDKREVQGPACLALAQALKQRGDNLAANDAKAAEKIFAESETLFERAVKDFADVPFGYYGAVGKKAKSELFDLRHLRVGKQAPDVEGEDQDGKKFKLSDYKGKVVFLDFWSQF